MRNFYQTAFFHLFPPILSLSPLFLVWNSTSPPSHSVNWPPYQHVINRQTKNVGRKTRKWKSQNIPKTSVIRHPTFVRIEMGNSDQSPPFSEFSRGRAMGVGIPVGPVYVTKALSLHISGSFALVAAKGGYKRIDYGRMNLWPPPPCQCRVNVCRSRNYRWLDRPVKALSKRDSTFGHITRVFVIGQLLPRSSKRSRSILITLLRLVWDKTCDICQIPRKTNALITGHQSWKLAANVNDRVEYLKLELQPRDNGQLWRCLSPVGGVGWLATELQPHRTTRALITWFAPNWPGKYFRAGWLVSERNSGSGRIPQQAVPRPTDLRYHCIVSGDPRAFR